MKKYLNKKIFTSLFCLFSFTIAAFYFGIIGAFFILLVLLLPNTIKSLYLLITKNKINKNEKLTLVSFIFMISVLSVFFGLAFYFNKKLDEKIGVAHEIAKISIDLANEYEQINSIDKNEEDKELFFNKKIIDNIKYNKETNLFKSDHISIKLTLFLMQSIIRMHEMKIDTSSYNGYLFGSVSQFPFKEEIIISFFLRQDPMYNSQINSNKSSLSEKFVNKTNTFNIDKNDLFLTMELKNNNFEVNIIRFRNLTPSEFFSLNSDYLNDDQTINKIKLFGSYGDTKNNRSKITFKKVIIGNHECKIDSSFKLNACSKTPAVVKYNRYE